MISCEACRKVYSTPYNLKKHWKRQPMCEKWINLNPGLKDFIDHKFKVEGAAHSDKVENENTTCMACKTTFANVGNLNRHLLTSVICSKWDLYNDLEPVQAYIGRMYSEFDAPKYSLCHIIWNVYLIDKEMIRKRECDINIDDIIKETNIKYVVGILPGDEEEQNKAVMDALGVDYSVMPYHGHNMDINIDAFDEQCKKIEEHREKRENVFVFCNNGYQRSIPFLVYYLYKHHNDEVPTIERAIDIILPQVDKKNYGTIRNKCIEDTSKILGAIDGVPSQQV